MGNFFLTFSDGAKFAIIARNIFEGNGFVTDFSFWGSNLFSTAGISKLIPYSILPFFKIFGVNDFAVISSSLFFYILLILFTFLLSRKLFGNLVGLLSSLAIALNINLIDYATSGASEILVTTELVAGFYLIALRKKWATVLTIPLLVLIYFSRPQAFIFIAALIFYYLTSRYEIRRALLLFTGLGVLGALIDWFIIYPLSRIYPFNPIIIRGLQSIYTYSSNTAVSDALRGLPSSTLTLSDVFKKTAYNLYNFYKAIPQIFNASLFTLFVVGLLKIEKDPLKYGFKISSLFIVVVTFLVTALTIPFYRYLHPVIPFIYIIGTATLVWVVGRIFSTTKLVAIASLMLILFFAAGTTFGKFILDSRFEKSTHNFGKPPVYARLSWILRDNTDRKQIVVTNLDTWGSWYGERKTVWFPLEPKMIIDPKTGEIPFDAIYLTSYKIDDENYFMGDDWRLIFDNPENSGKWKCDGCGKIAAEFKLKGIYKIPASENYERQEARAILLFKK